LRRSAEALRAWLDAAAGDYGRCYLFGFSAGMMMAGALLFDDPGRFAGAVLLSGALALDCGGPGTTGRLAGLPVFFGRGALDDVIPASLVAETGKYLRERSGAALTVREYRHAHAISSRELGDVAAWFETL
jgi:phospholipase/carboxylesterase